MGPGRFHPSDDSVLGPSRESCPVVPGNVHGRRVEVGSPTPSPFHPVSGLYPSHKGDGFGDPERNLGTPDLRSTVRHLQELGPVGSGKSQVRRRDLCPWYRLRSIPEDEGLSRVTDLEDVPTDTSDRHGKSKHFTGVLTGILSL